MPDATNIMDTTEIELGAIVDRAAAAFPLVAAALPDERGRWLAAIADGLESAADQLVPVAQRESNLSEQRLRGELARTAYQLRTFITALHSGDLFEVIIDHADPAHTVAPAPDLRRMLQPLGPIAVYSASNFPFAFSVAGGDTASALATGCPVVVKAHPGHAELSAMMTDIVLDALASAGAPDGTFATVYGFDAGTALLRHPLITAGAFTGSTGGGRALLDIANARDTPIPFYGELGSINPVFITAEAAAERGDEIAVAFASSYTLGAGQFCTKPGVVFAPKGSRFAEAATRAVQSFGAAQLLNNSISERLGHLEAEIAGDPSVEVLVSGGADDDGWLPSLYRVSSAVARAHPWIVTEERFGPSAVVVEYESTEEFDALACLIDGTLTATLQASAETDEGVGDLITVLSDRAGRVLWNEWPTGVTVSAAMHHGGPYPSTTSLFTSVGITAARRFLRPVCYQSIPDGLLPSALRETNPLGIARTVDGVYEAPAS